MSISASWKDFRRLIRKARAHRRLRGAQGRLVDLAIAHPHHVQDVWLQMTDDDSALDEAREELWMLFEGLRRRVGDGATARLHADRLFTAGFLVRGRGEGQSYSEALAAEAWARTMAEAEMRSAPVLGGA